MRRLAALALPLVLAGCGSTQHRHAARSVATSFGDCVVYARGTATRVAFHGFGAETICSTVIKQWSVGDAFWSRTGQPSDYAESACSMRYGWDVFADVYAESAVEGNPICSALLSAGWTELPSSDTGG